jgi:pentatricopeptide repeat protein
MADPAPNEKVYNSLIEACCLDADTLDRSWRALRNMKKAGTSPSAPLARSLAWRPIIMARALLMPIHTSRQAARQLADRTSSRGGWWRVVA